MLKENIFKHPEESSVHWCKVAASVIERKYWHKIHNHLTFDCNNVQLLREVRYTSRSRLEENMSKSEDGKVRLAKLLGHAPMIMQNFVFLINLYVTHWKYYVNNQKPVAAAESEPNKMCFCLKLKLFSWKFTKCPNEIFFVLQNHFEL